MTSQPIDRATTQVRVPVAGMTCAACEKRVATALRQVPGVDHARASSKRGVAVLTVTDPPDRGQLEDALANVGYHLGRTPWLSHDRRTWLTAAASAVAVVAVIAAVLTLGGTGVTETRVSPGVGGLAVVALVGLVAGVSTCMALVGGVVLAVAATYSVDPDGSFLRRMRPHLVFQVGRVVGFGLLGAALGWLGSALIMPAGLQAALMITAAAVMTLLGIRLTGLSPRLAAWSPALPASIGRRFTGGTGTATYSDTRAVLAGAATFFLPCGFTQAIQLYALSTGSAATAGVTMAVFALGTSPGLLTLAGIPTLARGRYAGVVMAGVGCLLVGFAALNINGALAIVGVRPAATVAAVQEVSGNVRLVDGVQVVTMTADERGYTPATTYVAAGVPIRWEISNGAPMYCTSFLRSPDLGVRAQLPAGTSTLDVPALDAGTWPFACVMGMYSGQLVAVHAP